ncbi:MAG: hypothetical protein ABNH38_22685 [Tateyamaria sp.]|uniref:hypothetical protein n=1 Tax=Tateyamaria sp. TaxID=1929288 RepID=UPI0032DC3CC3
MFGRYSNEFAPLSYHISIETNGGEQLMEQKSTPEDLGGEVSNKSDGNSLSEVRLHNKSYARKLTRLACGIELTLVSVVLAVAFAQAQNMPEGSGLHDMVSLLPRLS